MQSFAEGNQEVEALKDIRRMMERSSRFLSLSGWSGIVAGIIALVGAYFAYNILEKYYDAYGRSGYSNSGFNDLKLDLLMVAILTLIAALIVAFYFTWRRAKNRKLPVWDSTSRRLTINMSIPLLTGGIYILAMLQHNDWRYIAPACLIFYGLSLVNASKYTLTDVRYLGMLEIILGLICTQFIGYGLYFWAFGFGVLHIIYGIIMWYKYDRLDNREINRSS